MGIFCRFIGHSYVYQERPAPPNEPVVHTTCARCGEAAIVLWDLPFPGGRGDGDPMIVSDDDEGRAILKKWREHKSPAASPSPAMNRVSQSSAAAWHALPSVLTVVIQSGLRVSSILTQMRVKSPDLVCFVPSGGPTHDQQAAERQLELCGQFTSDKRLAYLINGSNGRILIRPAFLEQYSKVAGVDQIEVLINTLVDDNVLKHASEGQWHGRVIAR